MFVSVTSRCGAMSHVGGSTDGNGQMREHGLRIWMRMGTYLAVLGKWFYNTQTFSYAVS